MLCVESGDCDRLTPLGLDPLESWTAGDDGEDATGATAGLTERDSCRLGVSGGVMPLPLARLSPITLTSSFTETP